MGLCATTGLSGEEAQRLQQEAVASRKIEGKMAAFADSESEVAKLLLLGAGESGKSTLFKQMISIYGTGFAEEERQSYIPVIFNNIIISIKTLCKKSDDFGAVSTEAQPAKNWVLNELKLDTDLDQKAGEDIAFLWKDTGIQTTYRARSKFQLTDGAAYFFDKISEVTSPSYMPTEGDILRCRVRTTGIVENNFVIEQNRFRMFDVGGQRNERKKWIHCFENVTAVLFVVAVSAYDQVLFEDENTNRMNEALNLFEEICNSRWFRQTSIILFLNKRDLFIEKVGEVSIRVCFPDYTGPDEYEPAIAFIQDAFETRNRNPEKQIYTHTTCATDSDNVEHVFTSVKDIVIRTSLNEVGLM